MIDKVFLLSVVTEIAMLVVTVVILVLGFLKKTARKPVLNPAEFKVLPLIKKEDAGNNTRRYTFGFPREDDKLGLPVGQHITFRFTETLPDGKTKNHQRSYTPVTGDDTPGSVVFVIKVYKKDVHPKFPEGGKMSQYVDSLEIGDTLEMRGPKGHMDYHSGGNFTVHPTLKKNPVQKRTAKHFGMIAGGTGITPMLQIIQAVLRDEPDSDVKISLLYANQTEDDILVREEVEGYAKRFPDRFSFHYTLDNPPTDGSWKYSTGFITKEMVEKHLPPAAEDSSTQILMCGPPPMIKFACIANLEALGFAKWEMFTF